MAWRLGMVSLNTSVTGVITPVPAHSQHHTVQLDCDHPACHLPTALRLQPVVAKGMSVQKAEVNLLDRL